MSKKYFTSKCLWSAETYTLISKIFFFYMPYPSGGYPIPNKTNLTCSKEINNQSQNKSERMLTGIFGYYNSPSY